MLAVLPFQNLTGDEGQEYFSDGLTEEMITQLGSRDPAGLGVIARASVMHFKHTQEPPERIGRELGAQYLLLGSVRRDASTVRVTAELIRARDHARLWAHQYDRQLSGLLTLQDEIAREITDAIQSSLGTRAPAPGARTRDPRRPPMPTISTCGDSTSSTSGPTRTFGRPPPSSSRPSSAIPSFARAWAALAASRRSRRRLHRSRPPQELVARARAAALRRWPWIPRWPRPTPRWR